MAETIVDGRGSGNLLAIDNNNAAYVKVIDSTGSVSISNPLDKYMATETDSSNSKNQFFGFIASDNSWYMLNNSGVSALVKTLSYMAGSSAFSANWAVRENLLTAGSFNTPGSVF